LAGIKKLLLERGTWLGKFHGKDPPLSLGNLDTQDDFRDFQNNRIQHWNWIAERHPRETFFQRSYRDHLSRIYKRLIPAGKKVLEIGCGFGDLLAAVNPGFGVGIDFSPRMITAAQAKHPELFFFVGDAHTFRLNTTFEVVIFSDLINDLWDVNAFFQNLQHLVTPGTRIIINTPDRVWKYPVLVAQKLKLVPPMLPQSWLPSRSFHNLLRMSDLAILPEFNEFLPPGSKPGLSWNSCSYFDRKWFLSKFSLTSFTILQPGINLDMPKKINKITILIPVFNEKENLKDTVFRIPDFHMDTEILFIDGNSSDGSRQEIANLKELHPEKKISCSVQPGTGKCDALRHGMQQARGDIVVILDADLSVPPEVIPRFIHLLGKNKADFINGVRLMYPFAKKAMNPARFLGNKFFSRCLSGVIGQHVEDTLCGTKAFWLKDYDRILEQTAFLEAFDPFGDFLLLIGAAKAGLRILDLPVRYKPRSSGNSKNKLIRHGWQLFRVLFTSMHRSGKLKISR
jgi:SAM-dependent methyltransferase